jgi:hypothetical protein
MTPAKRQQPRGGSRKGKPNRITREVKTMVLQALDKAGGVAYLARCAKDPKTAPAFLALLGKVLPLQITGPGEGPVQFVDLSGLTTEQLRVLASMRLPFDGGAPVLIAPERDAMAGAPLAALR